MENYKLINEKEYQNDESNMDGFTLASKYYLGEGVEKDETKAFYMFKELAEKENSMAQHNMGCFYEKGLCNQPQNYRMALEWFKKAADQGLKDSQFQVGLYYYYGKGVNPDETMAIDYLTKAAKQEFLKAQRLLGEIYYKKEDTEEAVKWLLKAADQGDDRSGYNLAHIYFTTWGYIKADDNKVISWLEPAAKKGMVDSQIYLGMLYHRRRKFDDAIIWLTEASNQNNKQAISFLAVYYHLGLGTEVNSDKTKELINKLAVEKLSTEDSPYTEKEMQDDLAINSYKVATELGLYAECDGIFDEAIKFYNMASQIAFNQSDGEKQYVESRIRIAKIFEKIGKYNIARSLYNQAKWSALGNGSFDMMNTVAIQELGLAFSQIKKDSQEDSSTDYFEFILDTLKSALDHYNERECALFGKCSSFPDERRIKDSKIYGYNKK